MGLHNIKLASAQKSGRAVAIDTTIKFQSKGSAAMSPPRNALETVESPNNLENQRTDYYGQYARVTE